MVTKAFILIETEAAKSRETLAALKQVEGVKSAETVTGPYDIIVIAEAETLSDIGDLINGKIHRVAGITRTVTCLKIQSNLHEGANK